jgi:hypothetical protein
MISPVYRSTPANGKRSKQQMETLLSAINEILGGEQYQITVRHLFYRLVSKNLVEKTEAAYKTLVWHLSKWRRDDEIAWSAFSDSTRRFLCYQTYADLAEALSDIRHSYRLDRWAAQDNYCEVWIEKDAMADLVERLTSRYDVSVLVCKGFPSLTALYEASVRFEERIDQGKEVTLFHLGDCDPSGESATEAVTQSLDSAFGCDVTVERLAITPEQIAELNLPTRPTKRSDSRSHRWNGQGCVEIDAIRPSDLERILEDAIQPLIDQDAWDETEEQEEKDLTGLDRLLKRSRRTR